MFARATRYAVLAVSTSLLAGCHSDSGSPQKAPKTQTPIAVHPPVIPAPVVLPGVKADPVAPVDKLGMTAPQGQMKPIRIDAGATSPMKDKAGNEWLADTGFADGESVDRGDVPITGTPMPKLYQTEHFGMTSFSHPVPNGKYTVKLHFAETFDGVTAAGERVFSATVEGKPITNIDPFKDGGALNAASVKSADVEVKDGKLDITFTENVQSPEINGIEIIPSK